MAVTAETPVNTSLANGVATVFPYAFTILNTADLVVTGELNGVVTTYTLGADYTVTGVGAGSGNITFTTAPANGTKIARYRQTVLERTTDYQDAGDFLADTVNPDFDRIWYAIQELVAGLSLQPTALRVPFGETVNPLPSATSRAGHYLGFDGSGNPSLLLAPSGSAGALASDLANVSDVNKGDKLLGVKLAKTGAVGRTQDARNADRVSVLDFGADNTGASGVELAVQAACDAGVKHLWFPDGQYKFTGSVTPAWNMTIEASSGAFLNAGINGLTFFSVPLNCYGTVFKGLRLFGNGFTNVTGFDLSNWRVAAGMYDVLVSGMKYGLIARTGCFGTLVCNFSSQATENPIQILANGSTMQILCPNLDNTVTSGGNSAGTGIYIALGASDNIGVRVDGGYWQGFDYGVRDQAIDTVLDTNYSELCTLADVYADGARGGTYKHTELFGPSGAAGFKLRNCDAVTVFDAGMASGARTVLYDVDSTNTNCVHYLLPSNASYGTPTGSLAYLGSIPIRTKGSSNATVLGTTTAGTATYSTQACKWRRYDDDVHIDLTVTWTGHSGSGNIIVALNLPSALNPASFSNPTLSLNVTICGVPFTGPLVAAYFNGAGSQVTLIQSSTAGAQSFVPLPAAGTLTIKGVFSKA